MLFISLTLTGLAVSISIRLKVSRFFSPCMSMLTGWGVMFSSLILTWGNNFKMVWIHTYSVLAKVVYMKSFWNNLILEMKHNPMGRSISFAFVGNPIGVSIMAFTGKPNPTTAFNFLSLRVKSYFRSPISVYAHTNQYTIGGHYVA